MKKKKRLLGILLSLVLILGLMPGMGLTAYADNTETLLTTITATGKEQASYSTENIATVSFSNLPNYGSSYLANWGWWGYGWTATVNAAEGYTITKCVFYDDADRTATDSEAPFVVETTEDDKTPKVNGTPMANTSKGIKKIEVYGYATPTHTHDFTYSASGGTITATCSNTDGNCTLDDGTAQHNHAVSLTLSATDTTYTGSAYTGASLTDTTAWTGAGLTAPTIEYAGRGSTSYTKSTTAPTAAGTYTASITVDTDKTATADFTISPMALTITGATATDRAYDKDSTAVTISGVSFKDSSEQAVALKLGEDNDYTVTGAMSDANAGDGKNVNVTVTLKNANYSLATNATTATVNIGKADAQTIADVTDTLLYTATSVSESVANKMPDDAGTLTYSAGSASKTGSVTVSNFDVNATSGAVTATLSGGAAGDTVTLPVTIGSTNYADSTVNVIITLTAKGTQNITADDVTVTYGDTDKKINATTDGDGAISYAVKDGSGDYIDVNAQTGALTIKKVPADGKAYVTVTAAETAAYAQATKDVTVTINKAKAAPATVTANNRTYDGTKKPLVTVDNSTLDGGTMYYAIGENASTAPDFDGLSESTDKKWSTSIPTGTEAKTYYVWYMVDGDDSHEDLMVDEPVEVVIAEVDKEDLKDAIDKAEAYYEDIKDEYPEVAKSLKDAIDKAKETADDENVTEGQVKGAKKALEEALEGAEKAEVALVKKMIEDLPAPNKVTKDDKDPIEKARKVFDALTPGQQEKVGEELRKKLEDDERALEEAAADKAAADKVTDQINALPAADKVTVDDKAAIEAARAAYDALTPGQKAIVDEDPSVLAYLLAAEEALEAAKTPIGDAAIAKIEDQVYTAGPIEPALKVTLDGKQLVAGADYDVAYKDNVEVGEATATVTGKGDYRGTAATTFEITSLAKKEAATRMADLVSPSWYLGTDGTRGGFFDDKSDTLYMDYTFAKGLMSGYKDNAGNIFAFGPDDDMSRAQAAVIIYRMANPDKTDTYSDAAAKGIMNKSGMTDVQSERYYTAAVNWCVEQGVITGYKDAAGNPRHLFGPDDPITREQLATIIGRYMDPKETAGSNVDGFSDRGSIDDWAKPGIAYCKKNGIMSGVGGTDRFEPHWHATRCQMAKVIAVTARLGALQAAGKEDQPATQADLAAGQASLFAGGF